MIALKEAECCAPGGRELYVQQHVRVRACRPQLKRDPLGGSVNRMDRRLSRLICSLAAVLAGTHGCASSASRPTPSTGVSPLRAVCGRDLQPGPDTLTVLVHAIRSIANSGITNEGKAQELRQTLPDHDTFLGLYSDLCWLASFGALADTDYHRLLDDVLPLSFPDADSDARASRLAAPELLLPANDAVFDHFPRRTRLEWAPVQGATRYLVEVEVLMYRSREPQHWQPQGSLPPDVTNATVFAFDFDGAQPGRWRVRAVDNAGHGGAASAWRRFVYLR